MCPSEEEIFDSVLSGAVEMDEQDKWYKGVWKIPLGILLYIPRRMYDHIVRPIKRRRMK